jgi:hypothetical protein
VVQYQAALQLAQGAPQLYDLPRLHRQMLDVLGIPNADKLVPLPDDQTPKDPISENMNALKGTPLKAFIYQDHDAHMQAHMNFIQDPMVAAQIGQNPMAQAIQGAMMAHIAEHLGFAYRKQVEERVGVPLPPPDKPLPEDVELEMSRFIAQASQQLLQIHQAQAAQKQQQQQAQDPLLQLQQQELQIKQAEVQRKTEKDKIDAAETQERLAIEKARLAQQERQATIKTQIDVLKNATSRSPRRS